jgi:hypothetical protein
VIKRYPVERINNTVIGLVKEWNKLIEKEKKLRMKNCKKCLRLLDIESNFYKDKRIKGGYKNICKICEGIIKIAPTHIFCNKCDSNTEYFNYSLRTKQCKNCYLIQRKNKKTFSQKIRLSRGDDFIYQKVEFKCCTSCSIEKEIDLFPSRKDSKDGYRNQCIECFKQKTSSSKKSYRKKNKKSIREKDVIYRKERMKTDPLYRAKIDARNIIRKALSEKGYSKKSRTEEILGCSFIEFKIHIESLFLNNMSWENRNEWHIDHIIPLAFAKNEKELLLINNYINLRPIWIEDNQLKSDNIEIKNAIYELIMNQRVCFDV